MSIPPLVANRPTAALAAPLLPFPASWQHLLGARSRAAPLSAARHLSSPARMDDDALRQLQERIKAKPAINHRG